jgi:energy-coupling factor transporter ATP-binding protein EcfA2
MILAADAVRSPIEHAAPMQSQEPIVRVSSLTKRYGTITAVDNVSLSLKAGTITGFLGPNGAGKTTTLRLLLGLAEPTAGEALVFGRRYRELEHPMRHVGAMLESETSILGARAATICARSHWRQNCHAIAWKRYWTLSSSCLRPAGRSRLIHSECDSDSGWQPHCSAIRSS